MKADVNANELKRLTRPVTFLEALGNVTILAAAMAVGAAAIQCAIFRDRHGWGPVAAPLLRLLFAFVAAWLPATLFLALTAGARWSYTGVWQDHARTALFMSLASSGQAGRVILNGSFLINSILFLSISILMGLALVVLFRWQSGDAIDRAIAKLGAGRPTPPDELYDPQIDGEG